MSDLPLESLDYQAVVSEYFLALRGSGLLLSPLDEELVLAWERRGIPVAVVCRGLRRGAETLREDGAERPPRSLRALRFAVDDEWRAYRSGRVGDAPPPGGETEAAAARLRAARALVEEAARCAAGACAEGYRAAWLLLDAESGVGPSLDGVEAALAAADTRILAAWLRALPPAERAALGRRVRLLAGPRSPATSRRGHRETLRAHVVDAARAAGLTCLRGSV